jgi:predicted outer membrane lipoprotein
MGSDQPNEQGLILQVNFIILHAYWIWLEHTPEKKRKIAGSARDGDK